VRPLVGKKGFWKQALVARGKVADELSGHGAFRVKAFSHLVVREAESKQKRYSMPEVRRRKRASRSGGVGAQQNYQSRGVLGREGVGRRGDPSVVKGRNPPGEVWCSTQRGVAREGYAPPQRETKSLSTVVKERPEKGKKTAWDPGSASKAGGGVVWGGVAYMGGVTVKDHVTRGTVRRPRCVQSKTTLKYQGEGGPQTATAG